MINHFENGRAKALNVIMNKTTKVGVKLENTWNGENVKLSTGKIITHKRASNGSWEATPSMSKEEMKEYEQKRKTM